MTGEQTLPARSGYVGRARYAHGESVWGLWTNVGRSFDPCAMCGGTGHVKIEGHDLDVVCPADDCYRGKVEVPGETLRYSIRPLTIGQVRIEHTQGREPEVTFMAVQTGIGSGTLWREGKLHDSYDDAHRAALAEAAAQGRRLEKVDG